MIIRMLFAALVFIAPAPADDTDCKNAMDQQSMNRCADTDYQKADAALNAAYSKLMAVLDDSGFKTKLKAAQRSWIQFRDAECTFETADNEGGSIHPMVYSGCLTRLTEERTKALGSLLACQKDAEKCGM
jgi:uncharacterized protein YecT (DUF1311 family)